MPLFLERVAVAVLLSFVSFTVVAGDDAMPTKRGAEFKDCYACPTMVVLPKGSFMMGSPEKETHRSPNEGPQRKVSLAYPLAVGKFEVTFEEWDACRGEGGCRAEAAKDEGRGRGAMPVYNVDWFDAQEYVRWLSAKTGQKYRLLTEAEWEYAARAGARTAYSWGDKASHKFANYGADKCCNGYVDATDKWEYTAPVGSFPPNAFGLHDLLGNLWEWTDDCYDEHPAGGPVDGSARKVEGCDLRVMRGGSYNSLPERIRAAFRDGYTPNDIGEFIGFRVARSD